jgi:hypothetical protein
MAEAKPPPTMKDLHRNVKRMEREKKAATKEQRGGIPEGKRGAARIYGECGAKKKQGGTCKHAKGYGTDHYGTGKCRFHGGRLPTHRKKAIREQAILMGAPKDVNPVDALYWCIRITAGEVEFLREQMARLTEDQWYEDTLLGKQFNVLVRTHDAAVERLAKFSKDAIGLGLAERAVRLKENYGFQIGTVLRNVLGELDLTQKQLALVPVLIRKHMMQLENQPAPAALKPADVEGEARRVA